MGYLFLSLALAAGITKGYCGKRTSGAIEHSSDSMVMNSLRMGLCVIIGFVMILLQGELSSLTGDATLVWISLLSGVSTAAFVVAWLLSIRSGAYMMVEVFLLIGVIVPITLCRIFLNEPITLRQIVAIAILVVAVYIMCTYNASVKGKLKPRAIVVLFLCGLGNGFADCSQKLFVKARPEASIAVFNLYTYLFAGAVLLIACIVFRRADQKAGAQLRAPLAVIKPIWIYVLIMAACLFAYSFFKTRAAGYLDAVQLYPLSQGASVLLSLLMSSLLFGEKINLRCIIGVVLSFAALLMINL